MAISSSPASLPSVAEILEPTPGAILRKRALGDWGVMIGGGFMVVLLLVAFGAPLLTWHDPLGQDLFNRYVPPVWHENGSWVHPFGTDKFGRDYYTRIIYGARVSLMIGFAVMLMSGVIGTAMGIAAGYFGGRYVRHLLDQYAPRHAGRPDRVGGNRLDRQFARSCHPGSGLPAMGAVRAGNAQFHPTGTKPRLRGGGGSGRLHDDAYFDDGNHAERHEQSDRRCDH